MEYVGGEVTRGFESKLQSLYSKLKCSSSRRSSSFIYKNIGGKYSNIFHRLQGTHHVFPLTASARHSPGNATSPIIYILNKILKIYSSSCRNIVKNTKESRETGNEKRMQFSLGFPRFMELHIIM